MPVRPRLLALSALAPRDAVRLVTEQFVPRPSGLNAQALDDAVAWLARTHDVTGRQGSSKGLSLVHGWLPAYPETTGYVLEVLLWFAQRRDGQEHLVERAKAMADWEVSLQEPDGGVMEGAVGTQPRRSIVFNTGQVLHGWLTLLENGHTGYEEAAERAAHFLVKHMQEDGTWRPEVEYSGMPHTYNSRVAWAMLRYARHAGDGAVQDAARRQLEWTAAQQQPNGWFRHCIFKSGMNPSTHGIAYTLRGLLEASLIADEPRWRQAVERTSEVLIRKLEISERLVADWDETWQPAAAHSCLTGTAQLGGVWLRLYAASGDARWLNAGLKAVDQAARHQETHGREIKGALAGSFPIWGRYAPFQYPNWATRFLAESLMLHEDAVAGLGR